MNRNIAIALLRDSFAQVVDNMVFRIMMILLAVMVLPAFLIQVGDEQFTVLFFIDLRYENIMQFFGGGGEVTDDAKTNIIDGIQSFLLAPFAENPVSWMGRSTVLMLCVFATAFFIPRTLEKGAADTIFSKPVSRLVLMLSRYFAGLLFVSICVAFAIGGVQVGLLLRSGYSSPGWLWLIPELIYSFAVFHAFSVLVGVLTRSSVAAILLTSMFFFFNGCAHFTWRQMVSEEKDPQVVQEGESDFGDQVLSATGTGFEVMHIVLPKTIDARLITELLRQEEGDRAVELSDRESGLTIERAPLDFAREPRSSLARDGVLWIAAHDGGAGEASVRLQRVSNSDSPSRVKLAKQLEDELEETTEGGVTHTEIESRRAHIGGRRADIVSWREGRGGEERVRQTSFFQSGEWIFTLEYDAESAWAGTPERTGLMLEFTDGMQFPDFDPNPPDEFSKRFGWRAPLLYNAWFSIGSTLAFIVLLLGIGWWKLSRIDF